MTNCLFWRILLTDYYLQNLDMAREFPGILVVWLAYRPSVVIYNAEIAEVKEGARATFC